MPAAVQRDSPVFILNGALAELLRREGLEAEAEQLIGATQRRHQVDVLVELGESAIAIEAEFAPARTVLLDAENRLPERPIEWRGLTVDSVFALVYPESLRGLPESQARGALAACNSLEFALVDRQESIDVRGEAGDGASSFSTGDRQRGSVSTLAEYLHDYWIRTAKGGSVEETVALASSAIERAASILKRAPSPHPLAMADSDPEATSALIWLNALLFQELLASNLDTGTLRRRDRHKRIPRPDSSGSPSALLSQWDLILEINWWPIFHIAREALRAAPPRLARLALEGLVDAAAEIAETGTVRRHDVAGRIFHRLLATRKFLATNYTTVPAAVLLAGLAFDREHGLWANSQANWWMDRG